MAYQRRGGRFRAGQPEPFRRIGRPRQQRFLLGQHCRGQLCHFRSARPAAAGQRAPPAEQVQINFAPQSTTGFAYDAASGTYGMLRADGTAQLDANTGAQARFDNLLVLYSASSLRDDGTTLDYDLSLGGGVWLNGSQLWHITWTQGTDSTFAFYDADGRPLTIRTGRSYIALVSSVTGQELTVLDSAGQNVLN